MLATELKMGLHACSVRTENPGKSTQAASSGQHARCKDAGDQSADDQGAIVGREGTWDLKDVGERQTDREDGLAAVVFAEWRQENGADAEADEEHGLGDTRG